MKLTYARPLSFFISGLLVSLLIACREAKVPERSRASDVRSDVSSAKALALAAYKKHIGNLVSNQDCHLAEDRQVEWIFVCKDMGGQPTPGTDAIVKVNKSTQNTDLIPGQ